MKFKSDNKYLFVEGIQFIDGKYETKDENEIAILKRYPDSIDILEEDKKSK